MEFKKYQHIERFGTDDVKGINRGTCYIFTKIDGTNGSVWLGDDDEVKAGSRNRELTLEEDNQGFYKHIKEKDNIKQFLKDNPKLRLFGEWLVPHTLKTYKDNAWEKFYVFDVVKHPNFYEDEYEYLTYEEYKPLLEEYNIEYIPPISIIENPKKQNLINQIDKTTNYLIKDEIDSKGEGIVIKNYDFENKYGKVVWAKITTSNFKEHFYKNEPPKMQGSKSIEEKIIDKYFTKKLIKKEYAKIVNKKDGWKSDYIYEFLGRTYHTLITEEIWNIIKDFDRPEIDFENLKKISVEKVKEVKSELF